MGSVLSKTVRLTVEIDGLRYAAAYATDTLKDLIPLLAQSLELTILSHMENNKED